MSTGADPALPHVVPPSRGHRPARVTFALFLMWALWANVAVSIWLVGTASIAPVLTVYLAAQAVFIYYVSQGAWWARIAYCVGVILPTAIILIHSIVTAQESGDEFLPIAILTLYMTAMWLLFSPSASSWFRKTGPIHQLFAPTRIVRALTYYWIISIAFIGVFGFLAQWFGWQDFLWYDWISVVNFPIFVFAIVFSRWLHRRQQDSLQSERNTQAAELTQLALAARDERLAGKLPPYVLYLRPFATTGRLPWRLAWEDRKTIEVFLYGGKFDFESLLGKSLRDGTPPLNVYAIGGSGGIGADKLSIGNEEWKALFTILAKWAHALVLCPFDRPGTRWEIDEILKNPELLAKTIFVLPPARRLWGRDLQASWEQSRRRLRERIPEFPPYRPGPLVFALRPADFALVTLNTGPLSLARL
jgi:hypothetical protein